MERCQELGMTANLVYSLQKGKKNVKSQWLQKYHDPVAASHRLWERQATLNNMKKSGFISANLHIPIKSDCSNSPFPSVLYNSHWLSGCHLLSVVRKSAPWACNLGLFSRRSRPECDTWSNKQKKWLHSKLRQTPNKGKSGLSFWSSQRKNSRKFQQSGQKLFGRCMSKGSVVLLIWKETGLFKCFVDT